MKQLLYWFVYLVTMLGLVLLGDPVFRLESFFVLFFAACLSHHFAVTAGKQSRTSRTSLLLVVVSLPWFISEPYLSDDVYRYALEGKAITQGVDVYQQAPSQYAKEVLLEVAGKVNHPELSSIYPPAALGFFAVSSFIPLEPLQSLRLLLFVCLLTLQRVLKAALRFEGQSVSNASYFVLHPLVVVETMMNMHLDLLVALFVFSAAFQLKRARVGGAALLLGFGVATKYLPLLLLPFFLKAAAGRRLQFILYFSVTLLVTFLPFVGAELQLFDSLLIYASTWSFNGPFYTLFTSFGVPGNVVRLAAWAVIACFIVLFLKRNDLYRNCLDLYGLVIVLSPVCYPWYLLPGLVFLPLRMSRAWYLLTCLSVLSYLVLPKYKLGGDWSLSSWVLLIQFTPPLLVLVLSWRSQHARAN